MGAQSDSTFIQRNNLRLHVVQAGPEDGPLVILLHGFPETWRCWINQIEPLAEAGFRVLVPDQRGYNLSDKPKGLDAYRLDQISEDVLGLIQACGREKAVLVGHDWGGVIAWVMSVLYPERVERMVILNAPYPTVGLRAVLQDPIQILRSQYVLFFQIPGLPEAVLRNNNWELLVRGLLKTSRPGAFSNVDFEEYRRAWWKKDAMTCMLNWYRALVQRPIKLPLKPRITAPTLLLWGVQDAALGRRLAQSSIELCEHGRLVFFEEATHWVHREEAKNINKLMIQFIEEE